MGEGVIVSVFVGACVCVDVTEGLTTSGGVVEAEHDPKRRDNKLVKRRKVCGLLFIFPRSPKGTMPARGRSIPQL